MSGGEQSLRGMRGGQDGEMKERALAGVEDRPKEKEIFIEETSTEERRARQVPQPAIFPAQPRRFLAKELPPSAKGEPVGDLVGEGCGGRLRKNDEGL